MKEETRLRINALAEILKETMEQFFEDEATVEEKSALARGPTNSASGTVPWASIDPFYESTAMDWLEIFDAALKGINTDRLIADREGSRIDIGG